MAIVPTDFSAKVEKESLNLSDGTSLEVTKTPGVDDATWEETKRWMEDNPEEARRMESFSKDAKALRDWHQTNTLHEYYQAKLGGGDDVVSGKLLGLERSPDFAHIFEDIKRGGAQAAMANYGNEPLMLKISRAMGGIPEEVKPALEKIHKSPVTIQEACKMGDVKSVKDYLSAPGADVGAKDSKGISCLAYAIGANRTAVVKLLMEKKANPADVDSSGGSGVHYAAAYGRKDLLEFLVKSGGDVNKKNTAGQTPLALATKNKQNATIDFLKSKKATL
eukprot:CAMPEP_0179227926 /NCGR_PEP_ID=MMETSP0797-20121207/9564_1 /TAXON_ID=47934 /ORGANISM="Dinophysis acuminata, Strain DAEP01" /LENGTH=277 /DNA_ID=CAMNT_0020934967 /DNA_START=68 /DNA_END=901 /DNA_ORIENTATION=-